MRRVGPCIVAGGGGGGRSVPEEPAAAGGRVMHNSCTTRARRVCTIVSEAQTRALLRRGVSTDPGAGGYSGYRRRSIFPCRIMRNPGERFVQSEPEGCQTFARVGAMHNACTTYAQHVCQAKRSRLRRQRLATGGGRPRYSTGFCVSTTRLPRSAMRSARASCPLARRPSIAP